MPDPHPTRRYERLIFAAILIVTVVLGARDIRDEASGLLTGDMARYMMNGVFLHDLVATGGVWSYEDLVSYAERYYARYPALSLGHHPPLAYAATVPFYAVFGVSMFAARLTALMFFMLAAWGLYALAKRLFGWQVAAWATLLFVTNLQVLRAGQYLLSEIPMLALVLAAMNALLRYCDTRRKTHFAWFVIAAVASLHAKQLAAFMLPVYAVTLIAHLGWRSLFDRFVLATAAIGVLLTAPLVVMTVALSPSNVGLATRNVMQLATGRRPVTAFSILGTIVNSHLSVPVMLIVAAGLLALVLRRDRRVILPLAWIATVVGGTVVFAAGVEPARYAFGAMPAYFLLAASLAAGSHSTTPRRMAAVALAGAVLWQAWIVRDVRPSGAGGYETTSHYVVDHSKSPTVLIDTILDTGYLVFFVRKHDPAGRLVLLRSDKVLVSGSSGGSERSEEIEPVLRSLGIQLVVVEERMMTPRDPLRRRLSELLKTDRFVELHRTPIVSRESRAAGVDLVVYEFKDAQPPDLDTPLDIALPLGRRQIRLQLRDVIGDPGK